MARDVWQAGVVVKQGHVEVPGPSGRNIRNARETLLQTLGIRAVDLSVEIVVDAIVADLEPGLWGSGVAAVGVWRGLINDVTRHAVGRIRGGFKRRVGRSVTWEFGRAIIEPVPVVAATHDQKGNRYGFDGRDLPNS